jgi:hypothetical protein
MQVRSDVSDRCPYRSAGCDERGKGQEGKNCNGMLKRAENFATHDESFLPGRVLENLNGIPQEKYRSNQ